MSQSCLLGDLDTFPKVKILVGPDDTFDISFGLAQGFSLSAIFVLEYGLTSALIFLEPCSNRSVVE